MLDKTEGHDDMVIEKRTWRQKWEGLSTGEKVVGSIATVLGVIFLGSLLWIFFVGGPATNPGNKVPVRVALDRDQVDPVQIGLAVRKAIEPRLSEMEDARKRLAEDMKKAFGDTNQRIIKLENKPGWTAADYQLLTDTIAGKK